MSAQQFGSTQPIEQMEDSLIETPLSLEVVRSLPEAEGAFTEWGDLMEEVADHSPFIEPHWMKSWWLAFARPGDEMRLWLIRNERQLVAVAPLFIRCEPGLLGPQRVLRLWSNVYSNRCNFVVKSTIFHAAIRCIVHRILSKPSDWDVAILGDLALEDTTTKQLRSELRLGSVPHRTRKQFEAPFLNLPGTWEDLEEHFTNGFRATLRRKCRKADQHNLRVELRESDESLAEVFAVDADSWQAEAGSGLTSAPEVRRFYELVTRAASDRGTLRVALLRDEIHSLAFELNLVDRGVIYNLKHGYRQDAKALSPGIVIREKLLRHSIESELTEFDFLGAAELHKLRWTETTRALGSVVIPGASTQARIHHFFETRVSPFIKRGPPILVRVAKFLKQRLAKSREA